MTYAVQDLVDGHQRVKGIDDCAMLNLLVEFLDAKGLNEALDAFLREERRT